MANPAKTVPANVPGNFFVDSTCINCDTCRQLAPITFREVDDASAVTQQPRGDAETLQVYQAILACPVGCIGAIEPDTARLREAMATFPLRLDGEVYYNGFNSEKSFGGHSYFVRHRDGNWLIDSPRYLGHLIKAFDSLGGVRYIFLTHEDDVGDAARYAERFGAIRIIHRADLAAQPDAEWVVEGEEPIDAEADFRIIPVPGHTRGSMALLHADGYLFSGDHLWWDRDLGALDFPHIYVWSEKSLQRSAEALIGERFEWVLPGHGERIHLPEAEMTEALRRAVDRRFRASRRAAP